MDTRDRSIILIALAAVVVAFVAVTTNIVDTPDALVGKVKQSYSEPIHGHVPGTVAKSHDTDAGILIPTEKLNGTRSTVLTVNGHVSSRDLIIARGQNTRISGGEVLRAERWMTFAPSEFAAAAVATAESWSDAVTKWTKDIEVGWLAAFVAIFIVLGRDLVLWVTSLCAAMTMASITAAGALVIGWGTPVITLTQTTAVTSIVVSAGLALFLMIILLLGTSNGAFARRIYVLITAVLAGVIAQGWFGIPLIGIAAVGAFAVVVPQAVAAAMGGAIIGAILGFEPAFAMVVAAVLLLPMVLLDRPAAQEAETDDGAQTTEDSVKIVKTSGFPRYHATRHNEGA